MSGNGSLRILSMSAEAVPFVKTGGLADVAGALPKALRLLGHDVRLAIPRYSRIRPDQFALEQVVPTFDVPMDHTAQPACLLQATISPDLPAYLVDNARYFDREGIYMYPDDAGNLSFSAGQPWRPSVILSGSRT